MIVRVDEEKLPSAAEILAVSWYDSHKSFCSVELLKCHTFEHKLKHLDEEMKNGMQLYMLIKDKPVGIVSINVNLIENLYILPDEQHKGYGTELLDFAVKKCRGKPCLWVIESNKKAQALYLKSGFHPTGKKRIILENVSQLEMEM